MHWQVLVCGLLVAATAMLTGFVTGKRAGYRRGCEQAALEAPLRLREDALRNGRCPVCDESKRTWYNVAKEVVE